MKARIVDFTVDLMSRRKKLTLELDGDFRHQFDELNGKDLDLSLKPYRKKRSLTANAYAWELIGKLAEALNLPPVDIYRNAIKRVGIYKDFCGLSESDAKTLKAAWEMLGIGWITEQLDYDEDGNHVTVRCYYGSSRYNTKQMARLIDDIVSDCQNCGIETKTPEEVDRLISLWKGNANE